MLPNPRKTLTVRNLGSVDITALKEAVRAIPDALWNAEDASKPNRFEALNTTRHIVFRFVSSLKDWRQSYDRPLWESWRPLIEPVLQQATQPYGYRDGTFPRIMLARLAAGAAIHPHRDQNPAAKWPHKIHVPLETDERVVFYVDGVGYRLAEGEATEVNNMAVHSVTNGSAIDRVHLIFEYYDPNQAPPHWLAGPA